MSRRRHLVAQTYHGLLWLLALVLIPLAIVVSLGREVLPQLNQHQAWIEQTLSERLGVTVTVDQIQGRWQTWSPDLVVDQLAIQLPGMTGDPLMIPRVVVSPHWWASVRDRDWRWSIDLQGLDLTVSQDAQGRWRLKGLSDDAPFDPQRAERQLRWLLAQPQVALTDSTLSLETGPGRRHRVSSVRLEQTVRDDQYRVRLRFRLNDQTSDQVAHAVVDGDPLAWRGGRWRMALRSDDLASWLLQPVSLPTGWQLNQLAGAATIWLHGQPERWPRVTVQAEGLTLQATRPDGVMERLDRLSGLLSASVQPQGWTVHARDVSGQWNEQTLSMLGGALQYQDEQATWALTGLSITAWRQALMNVPLVPIALRTALRTHLPEGVLLEARGQVQRSDRGWTWTQAQAQVKALSWKPSGTIPGVSGVAGSVWLTPERGLVQIDQRQSRFQADRWFREPLVFDRLTGLMAWRRETSGWLLASDTWSLQAPDARGRVRFHLCLPDQGAPDLQLLGRLEDAALTAAYRYTPEFSAGEKTVNWLQQALTAGRVTQGDFLFQGAVGPRATQRGHFELRLPVRGATLDYAVGWPALTDFDGVVSLRGRALSVRGETGMIRTARAQAIEATIDNLRQPVLKINSRLSLTLDEVQRLLAESPLRQQAPQLTRQLVLSGGAATADLSLTLPLRGGRPRVVVDAGLRGGQLDLPEQRLRFQGVTGALRFDSRRGLDSTGLKALLWNEPAEITLTGSSRQGRWWRQAIDAEVDIRPQPLGAWLDLPLAEVMTGRTRATARVALSVGSPQPGGIEVRSSLVGLTARLPEPLGKSADQARPLLYAASWGSFGVRGTLTVSDLTLRHAQGTDRAAALHLGLGRVPWGDYQTGRTLAVALPRLDVADWRPLLGLLASGKTDARTPWQRLSLETDQLKWGSVVLQHVDGQVRRAGEGYQVELNSLRLPSRLLPPLSGSALLIPGQDSWRADTWQMAAGNLRFSGSGVWQRGDQPRTSLQGTLSGRQLGDWLGRLQQSRWIEAERAQGELQLAWPGAPDAVRWDRLSGRLSLKLEDGRLRDAEGIGLITRGFGLLSAGNLMRRLRLDFSDVTQRGLVFDELSLLGRVRAGLVEPADVSLSGPTLSLTGRGRIDLTDRTLTQDLRVAVPMSSAVPLVGGLLGGPVVGGALVAADLLLDKPLARVTALNYRISGPWSDLKLVQEQLETDETRERNP